MDVDHKSHSNLCTLIVQQVLCSMINKEYLILSYLILITQESYGIIIALFGTCASK